MPMHASFLASYPDWTAFTITILLSLLLGLGVKESTKFNTILTLLNVAVIAFVLVGGGFHGKDLVYYKQIWTYMY